MKIYLQAFLWHRMHASLPQKVEPTVSSWGKMHTVVIKWENNPASGQEFLTDNWQRMVGYCRGKNDASVWPVLSDSVMHAMHKPRHWSASGTQQTRRRLVCAIHAPWHLGLGVNPIMLPPINLVSVLRGREGTCVSPSSLNCWAVGAYEVGGSGQLPPTSSNHCESRS